MSVTLKDIIGITKEIPEECFEEAFEKLKEIKEKSEREKAPKSTCVKAHQHSAAAKKGL